MMKKFAFTLILALLACSLSARLTWHAPEAEMRIRFNILNRFQTSVLVPLPQEANPADVAVYDDKGIVIPATPIRHQGKIIAVAVNGASLAAPLHQDNFQPNASLYLLPGTSVQNIPFDGKTVHMTRFVKTVTTRAHRGEEMMRMFANLHLVPYPQARLNHSPINLDRLEENAFGMMKKKRQWLYFSPKKSNAYARACVVASSMIHVTQPTKLAFGTDQPHVAWTVLVDAVPVADWSNANQNGMGPDIALPAGLHSIQLMSVQSRHERLPKLLVQKSPKDKPAALTQLLPPHTPQTLRLEFRDAQHLTRESAVRLQAAYSFAHAQPATAIKVYQVPQPDTHCIYLDSRGNPLKQTNPHLLLVSQFRTPSFRLVAASKSYTFMSLPPLWCQNRAMAFSLRLETPTVAQSLSPLPLALDLDLPPNLPQSLKLVLTVRCKQQDMKSKTLTDLQMPMPTAQGIIRPKLVEQDSLLSLTLQLDHIPVAAPLTARIITPQKDLPELRPSGNQLYDGKHHAILLIHPTDRQPQDEISQHSGTRGKRVVYDDFLLTSLAPGADLLPQDSTLAWFSATVPPGANPALAFSANLGQLIRQKPQRALLLVNPQNVRDNPNWQNQLVFAIQSCRQAGIQPELLVLPAIPDSDGDLTSQAAFQAKILARDQAIPVQDLHTAALLQKLSTKDWQDVDGIRVKSLNNQARAVLFNLIR